MEPSSSDPTSSDPAPSSLPRSRSGSMATTSTSTALAMLRSSPSDYFSLDAPPSLLTQSEILARLAHGPTLLPTSLANLISAVSVCSRISIRSAALFIEAILESVRQGTTAGLGLTRRALISAVASARTLHYVARGLDWDGKDQNGQNDNGIYLGLLNRYTNVGIYLINHAFTLAELFSIAGLSLTMSTTSLGFSAAEESVRLLDSLLGSGETSRALSAIIALVRSELADDPTFTIAEKGVIPTLALLTKTLTAFVCLQAATSKRTAKEMKMRVVYDCTVVAAGAESTMDFIPFPSLNGSGDHERESYNTAVPISDDVGARRRSRAPSVELAAQDLRRGDVMMAGSTSPRAVRSRTSSVVLLTELEREELEEETEIVEELTELCGMDEGEMMDSDEDDSDPVEATEKLPPEVRAALEELRHGAAGKTFVTSSMGSHYEIEVTETTTTTTTTVRTTESTSAAPVDRARTIARRTTPRTRPLSSIFHMAAPRGSDIEEGDTSMEDRTGDAEDEDEDEDQDKDDLADEWVEIGESPRSTRRHLGPVEGDTGDVEMDTNALVPIPVSPNGRSWRTSAADDGSKPRLQVVFRTMTKKFTQRKRTIRRVEQANTTSVLSSGESTPRPRRITASGEENIAPTEPDLSPLSSPTTSKSKIRVLKAFGKALKSTKSGDNLGGFFSPKSGRSSRTISRESTTSVSAHDLSTTYSRTPPRSPRLISLATLNDVRPADSSKAPSRRPSISDLASAVRRGSLAPIEPLSSPAPPHPQSALSGGSAMAPRLRRAESMVSIVTTCKHQQETPTEEPEPKAANFPRQHLVANLQRFMRYSSAAYGQAFLRILGLGKSRGLDFSFPHTKTHANNHAFAHHVGISVDDILLDSYTTPGGGIFDNHRISPIVTYLAVDHEMQAIVLSCRGSLGLSDILVDLVCSYEQIHVPDGDPLAVFQVHAGMWHAATRLQRGLVHQTIKEALEMYPNYGLVLTGHSLGGGVASLLSLLWSTPSHVFERNRRPGDKNTHPPIFTPFVTSYASGLPAGRPIHCYVFGPPCVASPDLVRYCRGLVTSTTHNNDIVPTLSIGTLRDLKTMAMNLHEERGNGTTREIIGRVCGIYQRKLSIATTNRLGRALPGGAENQAPSLYDISDESRMVALTKAEISAGRGSNRALDPAYRDPTFQEVEKPEEVVVNDYLWSVMRTLRADNDNDKLYPPGEVYVIENYTVFIASESRPGQYARREGRRILLRAVNDVEKRFSEPVFGKTLFMDHSPTGYEENVDLLARAVLG